MSLLLRRRALMASRAFNSWDGKECLAVGSNGRLYYSVDYGKSFVDSNWSNTAVDACITRNKSRGGAGAFIFLVERSNTKVWWTTCPLKSGNFLSSGSVDIGAVGQSICASGDGLYAYVPINTGTSWQTGYTCTIKKITRSGNTLSQATKGTFSTWDQAATWASACSNNGKYAVIGGASGYTNAFQTVNTGETWTECLATSSFGNGVRQVACNFSGTDWLVASTGQCPHSLHNGLASWSVSEGDSDHVGVAFAGEHSTSDIWYRQLGTGVLKIFNRHASEGGWPEGTWNSTTSNMSKIKCNRVGNRLIGIHRTSGLIYYSWNYGRTWTQSSTPSGVTFLEIDMTKCD